MRHVVAGWRVGGQLHQRWLEAHFLVDTGIDPGIDPGVESFIGLGHAASEQLLRCGIAVNGQGIGAGMLLASLRWPGG